MHVHILGSIAAVIAMAGYLPQILHLVMGHCGAGISVTAYALWASASALLCVYAIVSQEPVFIALQGYHAVACSIVVVFGYMNRNRRCAIHQVQ